MLVLLVLFVDDAIFTLEELNICETWKCNGVYGWYLFLNP
jgi:hypothetical protein